MPTNRNALARYRTIDRLLSDGSGHSMEELRKACSSELEAADGDSRLVSRVTIYADLDELRNRWGVEIESTHTRPVLYRYAEGSKTMNGSIISSGNMSEISYVLDYLDSVSGLIDTDKIVKSLKKKLDKSGGEHKRLMEYETNHRLLHLEDLWKFYRFIREERPVIVQYRRAFEECGEIDFQPWFLKQYSNRWYIIGWKYDSPEGISGKIRNLALDRVEGFRINVSRSRFKYIKECDIDFEEYFKDIIGVTLYEGTKVEEVELHCDLTTKEGRHDYGRLCTKSLHPSQTCSKEGNTGVVKLQVRPNPELYSNLAAYPNIEVVGSEKVREDFLAMIRTISSHYPELKTNQELGTCPEQGTYSKLKTSD